MRKVLCICFAMIMAITGTFAFADWETTEGTFKPTALTILDNSATEWTANEANRCLFTIISIFDYTLAQDTTPTVDFLDSTFCGRVGLTVSACAKCTEDDDSYWVVVAYTPGIDEVNYITFDADNLQASDMEELLRKNNTDGLYENDLMTMIYIIQEFQELMES